MERVNIVLLASLAGALGLFGLRLFSSSDAPGLTGGAGEVRGLAGGPDGARDRKLPKGRIAMYGGEAGEGRKPTPGGTPGVKKPYSHGESGDDSAEMIAGLERRRDVLSYQKRRARGDGDVEQAALEMPDLMAGRVGAVPKAPGGRNQNVSENPPEPQPEEQPKKNDGSAEVLLRIPFNGSVDAEIGGGAVQSDGLVTDGDQVEFPENAQYSFPLGKNVNSDEGTIAFDINPNWAGSDPTNNSLVQIRDENVWENALSIVKNYSALRFIIHDSSGVEYNVNIPITDWAAGQSRQVTATWNGDGMSLFVDGVFMGETQMSNPLNFSETTPVHIGSDFPGTSYVGAAATIGNFTVYGRALTSAEIGRP
jgi:hypothetical protein